MAESEDSASGSRRRELYPVLVGVPPQIAFPLTHQAQGQEPTTDADRRTSPSQFYTGRPLVIPSLRLPAPRQNYCHHSTVTRQWRIDENETCDSCGRRPYLRWFYICTEDTSGYSDPIDSDGSLLSSWVTEAILAGEYTDEQRETLIQQKLEVLRLSERERNPSTPSLCSLESRLDNNSTDSEAETRRASQLVGEDRPVPPVPARCSFRACYHCERRLQERTWASINEVCNDPDLRPPSAWDLWDRPVSDARIASNLGLRPSTPPRPPPHISPYLYRVLHSYRNRSISHNRNVSSFNLHGLMRAMTTIEEVTEETETLVRVRIDRRELEAE